MANRRPKLSIMAPNASPDEAAAVVAALERFMRETAASPAPATAPGAPVPEPEPAVEQNPWLRAALHEGVMREPGTPLPWI